MDERKEGKVFNDLEANANWNNQFMAMKGVKKPKDWPLDEPMLTDN